MYLLLEDGGARQKRCKLLVCGREEVGKTTLSKALGDAFFSDFGRYETPRADRTVGVNVAVSIIDGAEFSVWDFAGQVQFYATHELFLVDNSTSVFVVLCKLSDPESKRAAELEYWIRFVWTNAGGNIPSIVLCGTHADQLESDQLQVCLWGQHCHRLLCFTELRAMG